MSAVEPVGSLTPELLDLMEHEKAIEQGLASFIDVGNALIAIKTDKKYRHVGYSTFEDYCQGRWGISREHGRRLTLAAATVEALERDMPPTGGILPTSERQVRPLAALPTPVAQAEAWAEAVDRAGGDQPTAAEVTEVVEERRTPRPVPKPLPTPAAPVADVSTLRHHPATYPDAVLDVFREFVRDGDRVLDPFGGTGRIHELANAETFAIEIEQEWAQLHPRTVNGDARLIAMLYPDATFDVIATSPAYGNRLADGHYNASDAEARQTYAFSLGRALDADNGAGMHFGTDGAYERLHVEAWRAAAGALRPGGLFLLNCKDFQRDGRIIAVTGWHIRTLVSLSLSVVDLRTLAAAGLPFTTAKPLSELVVILRKATE